MGWTARKARTGEKWEGRKEGPRKKGRKEGKKEGSKEGRMNVGSPVKK